MIISGARYAVENPIPFRIPSVAAPHPNKVERPTKHSDRSQNRKYNTDDQRIVRDNSSKQSVEIRDTEFCRLVKDRKYEQKSYQRSGIYHAVEEIFINHPAGLPPILDLLAGNECVKTSDNKSKDNRNFEHNQKHNRDNRGNQRDSRSVIPSSVLLYRNGCRPGMYFFCLDSTNTITIINAT